MRGLGHRRQARGRCLPERTRKRTESIRFHCRVGHGSAQPGNDTGRKRPNARCRSLLPKHADRPEVDEASDGTGSRGFVSTPVRRGHPRLRTLSSVGCPAFYANGKRRREPRLTFVPSPVNRSGRFGAGTGTSVRAFPVRRQHGLSGRPQTRPGVSMPACPIRRAVREILPAEQAFSCAGCCRWFRRFAASGRGSPSWPCRCLR